MAKLEDALATPHGFANGMAMGLAFWLGVVLTIAAEIIWRALH